MIEFTLYQSPHKQDIMSLSRPQNRPRKTEKSIKPIYMSDEHWHASSILKFISLIWQQKDCDNDHQHY
jgi:hypothetical protein